MMFGIKKVAAVVAVFEKAIVDLEKIEMESQNKVDELSNQIVTVTYERDDARAWLTGIKSLKAGSIS